MLTELRINNFAIIEHLELEFQDGLVTFTGETGAGKSIILDAIEALVGAKTDTNSIRAEAERAQLEAVFQITATNKEEVLKILERENLQDESQYVTLSREIRREGRTLARINGQSVNISLLRELGSQLVDIHGQSEHLSLLNVRTHLNLIDRYAVNQETLNRYKNEYRQLRKIQRELDVLHQQERDAERRSELLTFQANEIEAARLLPAEGPELKEERNRLANAEGLAEMSRSALSLLDEGDAEMPTIRDLVGQLLSALTALVKIDGGQNNLLEQGQNVAILVDELSRDVSDYLEQIEYNPRRLETIEARLELLRNLERKYGGSIESVINYAAKARLELDQIAHSSQRIAELQEEEQVIRDTLSQTAMRLSASRRIAAKKLAEAVEGELSDLSMAGARFEVAFNSQADPQGLTLADGTIARFDETGTDLVEFMIAPNPGEGLKPMVKIASGGETARLMLALKKVLAQADEIPTLIFDEVDQGIGGRVGFVVGEKLWQLAREHQVLCVTHLPQLAAFGDRHYRVEKQVKNGRTQTVVTLMQDDQRLRELAQMLGAISETHLSTAEETLRVARQRTGALRRDDNKKS
jgi:DNA repair protein RecN (Recombination protein N)